MMESQACKIGRFCEKSDRLGYDIFISLAFAPFARPMVSQVCIDTVNVKLPTSYGCYRSAPN